MNNTPEGNLSETHDLCRHDRIRALCDDCTVDTRNMPHYPSESDTLKMENHVSNEAIDLLKVKLKTAQDLNIQLDKEYSQLDECFLDLKKKYEMEMVKTDDLEGRLEGMKRSYARVHAELSQIKDIF